MSRWILGLFWFDRPSFVSSSIGVLHPMGLQYRLQLRREAKLECHHCFHEAVMSCAIASLSWTDALNSND